MINQTIVSTISQLASGWKDAISDDINILQNKIEFEKINTIQTKLIDSTWNFSKKHCLISLGVTTALVDVSENYYIIPLFKWTYFDIYLVML